MQDSANSMEQPAAKVGYRERFYLALLCVYFLPLAVIAFFLWHSLLYDPLLLVSLGIAVLGGASLLILLSRKREERMRQCVDELIASRLSLFQEQSAPQAASYAEQQISAELRQQVEQLQQQLREQEEWIQRSGQALEEKNSELQKIYHDMGGWIQEREVLSQQQEKIRLEYQQQLQQKEELLSEYRQAIEEQQAAIEKGQRKIIDLEARVRDLSYEIKTVLQIEPMSQLTVREAPPHPFEEALAEQELAPAQMPSYSPPDLSFQQFSPNVPPNAFVLLQRYIQSSEKLTSASHLSGRSSRFLGLSTESFTIDLRRLFDIFRDEPHVVMIYSLEEQRVIYVNNQVRTLLGWGSDKFVKDFPILIQRGWEQWQEGLHHLNAVGETRVRLVIKNRVGEDCLCYCTMGLVKTGSFANNVIAVLEPTV